ncbi:sensor domain-containing diguanylate cyclase [Comamonas jiangduensis]|uniref:sensor domain-containing diguanylate cyclase n=1 Tax=Comamonas jiangduensis TaxID=1194168 RepID=UPI0028A5F2E7|nr:diguanylate cyclase [Comamonas jiangduensis]
MDTAFVWDQHFVTDLDSVDEQHHALVDLFNELSRGLFSKRSDREVVLADTYARLLAYTEHHFQEEEALMQTFSVDPRHVESHRSMHQQFVEQVIMLWAQRTTMSDPATTLVGFLTSWLGLHILGIDQSMARQIKSIQDGMLPADAYDKERGNHDNGTQALLKMIGKLYTALTSQNAQLALANQTLEARVARRTKELEAANTRLKALSNTDALLGIANRAHFNERLEQTCAMARRSGRPVGMVLIDVDYFKRYNDRYGHLQGDACLQAVAKAIQSGAHRETDLVARYGGEEFAVILPDTTMEGAMAVAQRMVDAVQALGLEHESSPIAKVVTISAGVFSQVPTGAGAKLLVREADEALYRAKSAGRNRVMGSAQQLPVHAQA